MKVIGLIGGVAAGKSSVAKYLEELGAVVVNGDLMATRILEEPETIAMMQARWRNRFGIDFSNAQVRDNGTTILTDDHRRKIASIVFKKPEELKFLEAIVWNQFEPELRFLLDRYGSAEKYLPLVVLDIPLLLDFGLEEECDQLWYVDCDRTERLRRFIKRRNYGEDAAEAEATFTARELRQLDLDAKATKAEVVFNNGPNTPLEELHRQVREQWSWNAGELSRCR